MRVCVQDGLSAVAKLKRSFSSAFDRSSQNSPDATPTQQLPEKRVYAFLVVMCAFHCACVRMKDVFRVEGCIFRKCIL